MVRKGRASFSAGYVQANSESNLVLSEGIYSLSSRSNVPYVSLIGANSFQKIFSWGEIAEVPCGETVTVKNASQHAGNIFINEGIDPYSMPAAITVPIRVVSDGMEFVESFAQRVDTRRARRAFLAVDAAVESPQTVKVIGVTLTSLNTVNMVVPPDQGSGYVQEHILTGQFPLIPLGFKAPLGDDARPHVLLDAAYVILGGVYLAGVPAYYVVEY